MSETRKTARYHGWLAFMGNPPLSGIDPHPAYAPHLNARLAPSDATEWARLIGIHPDRAHVLDAIADDAAAMHLAFEEGDLEDIAAEDICLPVCVDARGMMTVFEDPTRLHVLATHSPRAIWGASGMDEPATSAHTRRAQDRAMRTGSIAPAIPAGASDAPEASGDASVTPDDTPEASGDSSVAPGDTPRDAPEASATPDSPGDQKS